MSGRKRLYVVLGAAGALVLLLGGLGGVSVVSAQEVTPESEDAPNRGIWDRGGGLFAFGRGDQWTMFDTAADMLGLTPEELFAELHAGRTMEEVAEAQGVEMEDLEEALDVARADATRAGIEQAVEDGEMSQEQADWLLEGLEQGFMRGPGFGHGVGRGMRGDRGRVAPPSDQSDTSAPTLPSSSSF
ncbi:MAG: hypothetical protein PVI07_13040 [Anaerolineae bacterium]|jgi:hypothetical protein